jgi:starvation-inducible outer membrane lipoprotein
MRHTILAAALAVAACAPAPARLARVRAPSNSLVDQDGDDEEVVCQDERMTGTNISRLVCRTPEEIAEERRAAQDWEKHPRNDRRDRFH